MRLPCPIAADATFTASRASRITIANETPDLRAAVQRRVNLRHDLIAGAFAFAGIFLAGVALMAGGVI